MLEAASFQHGDALRPFHFRNRQGRSSQQLGDRPFVEYALLMKSFRCRWPVFAIACIAGFSLYFTATRTASAQQPPTPPPYDPAAVPAPGQTPHAAFGEAIYQQNCAPCHGSQGASDGPSVAGLPAPPPMFADPATVWERSPAEYFHITKFGRIQNLMPPWGNQLNDSQIWQAVYYAWSLHTSQEQVANGASLYDQSCAACHGASGAGDGPESATAGSGELPNFSDSAAMIVRTQAELAQGWQETHPEFGEAWSEDERRQVLDYVRTFHYQPPWESAYEPGAGELQVQVIQGTADAQPVANLPLTLTAYINFEPVQTYTATTDSTGQHQFSNLATDEGIVYLATTNYAGLLYNSDIAQLTPLTLTGMIELPVYETTTNGDGVHINRANWLVDFEPGALRVGVILIFSNQLDRTYIGQPVEGVNGAATLALAVPPGATEIEFEDGVLGGRYQQVGERIYDVAPVPPGADARQLIYSYLLPYSGTETSIAQAFLYPVGALSLLITDLPGVVAEAPLLTEGGVETIQGVNFRRWNGANLDNPTVALTLRNLPPPEGDGLNSNAAGGSAAATPALAPSVAIGLGAVLCLVLAGVLYIPLRRSGAANRLEALQTEQAALITEIAELDDEHASGTLSTGEWSQERARLKSALLAVATELAQQDQTGNQVMR
jgi:mono/diheme cytochrome c family protein